MDDDERTSVCLDMDRLLVHDELIRADPILASLAVQR